MSEALELVIRDLLLTEGNSDRVAKSILKRLTAESPSRKERQAFVNFLIHGGYFCEVLELYANWFKEKFQAPFMPICFILHQSGFKPGEEFLRQLFNSLETIEEENRLSHFLPWEAADSRFIELKENTQKQLAAEHQNKKIRNLEKLEYLRSNRMIEEEEKFLDALIEMYPEENQLAADKKNFKQRWARAIIARKSFESFDGRAEYTEPVFTEEETIAGEIIAVAMFEIAKTKPKLAYNLALGLYFLDMYAEALNTLSFAPAGLQTDWFLIELLIKSRRFVECLDACATIELRYAADPETVFGTTYYRALSLNGLGQTATAKDLLRSLVSIRPSYRSAHSLLLKWGG